MILCWVVKTLVVPPLLVLLDRDADARSCLVVVALRDVVRTRVRLAGPQGAGGARRRGRGGRNRRRRVGRRASCSATRWSTTCARRRPTVRRRRTCTTRGTSRGKYSARARGPLVIASRLARRGERPGGCAPRALAAAPGRATSHSWRSTVWPISSLPTRRRRSRPCTDLGDRIERARARGFMSDDEWGRIRDVSAARRPAAVRAADVPDSVADRFTDANGVRGALVTIESDPNTADDLRGLVRFADAFRETRLPGRAGRPRLGQRRDPRRHAAGRRARRSARDRAVARADAG